MKRIFITGYNGFLGKELLKRGFLPLECDITQQADVEKSLQKAKPALLLHLAGKSNVDYCQELSNAETVIQANVRGTYYIFQELAQLRLPGTLISTSQVWRGGFFEKHNEDSKITRPVNFYGMSKLSAEACVSSWGGKVIRTSYLFNAARLKNNLENMRLNIKQDYPTFITRSFIDLQDFCDMLELYCDGYYKMPAMLHLAGNKNVSWYRFMRDIEKHHRFEKSVKPRFFEKKGFAPRPHYGGLNVEKSFALGFPQTNYLNGIARLLNES
jgi:dTDP-4-dehydrorhamnose reductase